MWRALEKVTTPSREVRFLGECQPLLRGIGAVFDFCAIRKSLAPYYSSTGRPSIDPEPMMCMLLIGYSYGIRSERRLCE
jgi:hypothetical protein